MDKLALPPAQIVAVPLMVAVGMETTDKLLLILNATGHKPLLLEILVTVTDCRSLAMVTGIEKLPVPPALANTVTGVWATPAIW